MNKLVKTVVIVLMVVWLSGCGLVSNQQNAQDNQDQAVESVVR